MFGLATGAKALTLLLLLGGCALSYTDSHGLNHMVGLMDVAVNRSPPENIAGSIVDITAVGLSVLTWQDRINLGIGYVHLTIAEFRDNALAIGPFDRVPVRSGTTNGGNAQ